MYDAYFPKSGTLELNPHRVQVCRILDFGLLTVRHLMTTIHADRELPANYLLHNVTVIEFNVIGSSEKSHAAKKKE
jgi:hypothetical protein